MRRVNNIKLLLALVLMVAGVVGFFYLRDSAMVFRVVSILLGFLMAIAVAWFTTQGQRFYVFCMEASEETKKVVWPTRKETIQTSLLVFAFVVTMALFLWLVDAGLLSAVKLLMNRED